MGNLFLYFILTVTLVLGEDDGSFIFSTGKLEVKLNDGVQLDCGINGEYRYCVWEHGNDIFKVEEVYEDKYPGKSEPWDTYNINQCGIVLDRVSHEDYGKWTCKIFIIGGSHDGSKDVVQKYERPKVTTIGTTKNPVTSTKSKNTAAPWVGATEKPGISSGGIAGIVISCLFVVAAIMLIIYLKKKKQLCFSVNRVDSGQKQEYNIVDKSDTA